MKCTINDIANVISESIPNPAESGYDIFVGLEHYDSGEVKITRYGSTDSLVTAVKVFKKGDILLARRNVYLKRAGLVDFDGVTSGDSIVLRVKPDLSKLGTRSSSVQKYLPFVLNTEEFWNYAEKYSDGTMSKRLSPKTLLQYEFEIPDDVDNKNDLLWSAFETKESYRTMIKAIDEMVKSQFIEMFGRVSDKEPKFCIKKLSDCCSYISDGSHFSPEGDVNGQYPMLSVKDMTETGFSYSDCKYIGQKDYDYLVQNGCKPKRGDVLVAKDGSYFKYAFALDDEKEQAILSSIAILRPINTQINSRYLAYYMLTDSVIQLVEDNYLTGTAIRRVILKGFKEIPIIIPSLKQQEVFVIVLNQADKSKFELKRAIEKIDKVMRSLMQ